VPSICSKWTKLLKDYNYKGNRKESGKALTVIHLPILDCLALPYLAFALSQKLWALGLFRPVPMGSQVPTFEPREAIKI
jgi:hypothetical protein